MVHIGKELQDTRKMDRPSKVIVVIITDGQENASKEFDGRQIARLIEEQKQKYAWEFFSLGTEFDVEAVASDLNIDHDRAFHYGNTEEGIGENYDKVNFAISYMRAGKTRLDGAWKRKKKDERGNK